MEENYTQPIENEDLAKQLDAFRRETREAHKKLAESVKELVELFNNTSAFFRATIKIAKYVTIVGAAVGVVWALFKNIIQIK